MSARDDVAPRCEDIDLDALAYGELAPSDELWARSHISVCRPCHEAHELLVAERRSFGARARAAHTANRAPDPLPSFEALLARAEREPAPVPVLEVGTRWEATLRSWSSPWRGAVLQGAVGMFAIGMLVQVAILRPTRSAENARTRASAAAVEGAPSAALDPWGESIADCGPEEEVCVEQALAMSSLHAAAPAVDPCASTAQSSVDWSQQSSASGLVEGYGDAVCAPDAI